MVDVAAPFELLQEHLGPRTAADLVGPTAEHQAQPVGPLGGGREELQAAGIRPLEVVDDEHRREHRRHEPADAFQPEPVPARGIERETRHVAQVGELGSRSPIATAMSSGSVWTASASQRQDLTEHRAHEGPRLIALGGHRTGAKHGYRAIATVSSSISLVFPAPDGPRIRTTDGAPMSAASSSSRPTNLASPAETTASAARADPAPAA